MIIADLVLLALMCPFGANGLVAHFEKQVIDPPACAEPDPETIVVLAAGFSHEPLRIDDYGALNELNIYRLLAGINLWRQIPGATLAIAGGGGYPIRESQMLNYLAEQLGVPSAAIRTERDSQTTWENAANLRALVPPLPKKIWLVSSALHLPRAKIAFEAAGFEPCLFASDHIYKSPGGLGYFLPQSSSLVKAESAIHELGGELIYRWRAHRIARAESAKDE